MYNFNGERWEKNKSYERDKGKEKVDERWRYEGNVDLQFCFHAGTDTRLWWYNITYLVLLDGQAVEGFPWHMWLLPESQTQGSDDPNILCRHMLVPQELCVQTAVSQTWGRYLQDPRCLAYFLLTDIMQFNHLNCTFQGVTKLIT